MPALVPAAPSSARPPAVRPPGPPPLGEDARRALTALLRERAHGLPRFLPARLLLAARLAPALLHASFPRRLLEGDAPGVTGLHYRRRWSSLARALDLPPPSRAQRGRALLDAVLVIPGPAELEVVAVAAAGLEPEESRRAAERLEALQQVLSSPDAPVRATLLDAERLDGDPEACHRLLAFGALMAGRLTGPAWSALEASRRPVQPLAAAALAARAPAPMAALALTLMTRAPAPCPLDAALAHLAAGASPRHLSDHESFCVRWAGLVPGLRELLEETVLLSHPAAGPPGEAGELRRLVDHGRALAVACARAIRASGLHGVDPYTTRLWRETLGPGLPRLLLPALAARLAEAADAGRLRLVPRRAGAAFEVRLADGALLGRGAGPVQARARALALVAEATAADPRRGRATLQAAVQGLDLTWRELGQRLQRSRDRATLLLQVIAGGGARPGPPDDLLNRGPARALEFEGALATLLVPGRRPATRMLPAEEAVRAVLRQAPAGAGLEILAADGAAHPVATRLSLIAALLRDPSVPGPVAIEAGGRVYVGRGARGLRVHSLDRFVARPRIFTPDPDAPDLSVATGKRQGFRSRHTGVVECRVVPAGAGQAALLYADDTRALLREVVPLEEVEERLKDAREIIRQAEPPAVVAVRLSEGLEDAVRRAAPPSGARLSVSVRGALPFPEVEIGGERFGGRRELGWPAAAEALLARWPVGDGGVVTVGGVAVTAGGSPATPVLALYAAALVRRRLSTHLRRAIASYRGSPAGRREG